jgi:hypothetical protein
MLIELQLSDSYRIRPLDHLQWVLERRPAYNVGRWKGRQSQLGSAGDVWKPYAYCRTKAGLETALSRLRCDEGVHLDVSWLAHLPDFFPEVPDADPSPG